MLQSSEREKIQLAKTRKSEVKLFKVYVSLLFDKIAQRLYCC